MVNQISIPNHRPCQEIKEVKTMWYQNIPEFRQRLHPHMGKTVRQLIDEYNAENPLFF